MSSSSSPAVTIPNPVKFAFGGMAGMGATMFVQPLDLVKTRMQVTGAGSKAKTGTVGVITNIVKREGATALYTGLSAALLRQATYTTSRLGIYTWLFEKFSTDATPGFVTKALLGMTAGGCASLVGTPAEISLIRMTSDGRLPIEQQRKYRNVVDALTRITKEEGITTLWRGCLPTVVRAMVVNAAQLATYSQAKQAVLASGYISDGIGCHFVASMMSGLATTIASMPVDMAKTRIQNMAYTNGVPEYKGAVDVLASVVKKEGVFALWKGFLPYYMRLGPHTVLTFIFLEQMNAQYYAYLGVKPKAGL